MAQCLRLAWPNWFTTKDLILSGVTGATVVVAAVVGWTVVVKLGWETFILLLVQFKHKPS